MFHVKQSIPAESFQFEHIERRSRFIGCVEYFASAAEKETTLQSFRERFPKSTHIAFAFLCNDRGSVVQGMSDAGEPKGTAGMPIMKVLENSGLSNAFVAVVRYFGGTKLGTGGLSRAYSYAARQALTGVKRKHLVSETAFELKTSYRLIDGVIAALEREGFRIGGKTFGDRVAVCFFAESETLGLVLGRLSELFGAEIAKGEVTISNADL